MMTEKATQDQENYQARVAQMANTAFGPLGDMATEAYIDLRSDNDPLQRARAARQLQLVVHAHDISKGIAKKERTDEEKADEFMNSTPLALEEITTGLTTMIGALPGEDASKVRDEYEISATPADAMPESQVEFTKNELVAMTKMASLGLQYAKTIKEQGILGNHYLLAKQIWRAELLKLVVNSIVDESSIEGDKEYIQEIVEGTKSKFALHLSEAIFHNERTVGKFKASVERAADASLD